MLRDPFRCERCLCFWQPAVARANLVLRMEALVCKDTAACHERVLVIEALDRVVSRGRRRVVVA